MAMRYQRAELLHLRDSPLVSRPFGLPPAEEWMGPQTNPVPRVNKGRGALATGESNGAKPSLLGRLPKSTSSAPTDITLGPTKTVFPSALGGQDLRKAVESSTATRSIFGNFGTDSLRVGKQASNQDVADGKGDQRRDPRFGKIRGSSDEPSSWASGNPRAARSLGLEDGERSHGRRNGDRENDHETGNDRENRRYNNKGYGNSESQDHGATAESIKSRDWRHGERKTGRGFARDLHGGEQDPEWMVEEAPRDRKKIHTAQDMEEWKASMKAQEAAAKGEAQTLPAVATNARPESGVPVPKKFETPMALDSDLDKFFGLWNEPNDTNHNAKGQKSETNKPNMTKASKFTGFFSPQPVITPSELDPPPLPTIVTPAAPKAATEDEVGFQKILAMLGVPKPSAQQPAKLSTVHAESSRGVINTTPPPEKTSKSATPPLVSPRPKPHGLQNLLAPKSPDPNPEREFLLNLMRNKDPDPHHAPLQHFQDTNPLGFPQQSMMSPFHRSSDDDFMNVPKQHDKLNPSNKSQQRFGGLPERIDHLENDFPPPPHHHHHFAPPPGFGPQTTSFQPPPGFHQLVHHQSQRPLQAPPGFAAPGPFRNGISAPPGFLPSLANLNISHERGGPAPPPGFAGHVGPPPGFGMMGLPPDSRFAADMFDAGRGGGPGQYPRRE